MVTAKTIIDFSSHAFYVNIDMHSSKKTLPCYREAKEPALHSKRAPLKLP